MGCKTDSLPAGIPVQQMRDGQLGVVTNWSTGLGVIIGKVVQRHQDWLIVLGEHSGRTFEHICSPSGNKNCQVQLLKDGDVIHIDEIVLK